MIALLSHVQFVGHRTIARKVTLFAGLWHWQDVQHQQERRRNSRTAACFPASTAVDLPRIRSKASDQHPGANLLIMFCMSSHMRCVHHEV